MLIFTRFRGRQAAEGRRGALAVAMQLLQACVEDDDAVSNDEVGIPIPIQRGSLRGSPSVPRERLVGNKNGNTAFGFGAIRPSIGEMTEKGDGDKPGGEAYHEYYEILGMWWRVGR
ncbi:hypothetical protein C8J57DRAFT_1245996 [Mycena rebaudengoi]|nr:hypothetical protein C8J57DRAFT_1245996 [Mycena rebaudengoi]